MTKGTCYNCGAIVPPESENYVIFWADPDYENASDDDVEIVCKLCAEKVIVGRTEEGERFVSFGS